MCHRSQKQCQCLNVYMYASSLQESKNLRGAAAYNYILKPVPTGVLILQATVNELIQFSPFNELNGAAQMNTK